MKGIPQTQNCQKLYMLDSCQACIFLLLEIIYSYNGLCLISEFVRDENVEVESMKKIMNLLLILVLIIGSVGMIGNSFGSSDYERRTENRSRAGPTNVSGLISVDTTWTAANSPYHIVGNTTLNNDVTLTINAGVEVKFDNNTRFNIRGKMAVKGSSSNRVIFTNRSPRYTFSFYSLINGKDYSSNGTGVNYYIYIDRPNGGEADISFASFPHFLA